MLYIALFTHLLKSVLPHSLSGLSRRVGHGSRAPFSSYADNICLFKPYPSLFHSCINLSYLCIEDHHYSDPLSHSDILFFSQTLHSSSFHCDQTISGCYFLYSTTHTYTSLFLALYPCQIFNKCFHCSHRPILILHMSLSGSLFIQHALFDCCVLFYVWLIHMLMLAGAYNFLGLFFTVLETFLLFITCAHASRAFLPFTALLVISLLILLCLDKIVNKH